MRSARQNTVLLFAGFCIAIGLTFFFGYRAGRYAHLARWQNEPVRAWMSVPFVAHAHHVPEDALFNAIHIPADHDDHRSIRDIAIKKKVSSQELIRELETAIDAAGGTRPNQDSADRQ